MTKSAVIKLTEIVIGHRVYHVESPDFLHYGEGRTSYGALADFLARDPRSGEDLDVFGIAADGTEVYFGNIWKDDRNGVMIYLRNNDGPEYW